MARPSRAKRAIEGEPKSTGAASRTCQSAWPGCAAAVPRSVLPGAAPLGTWDLVVIREPLASSQGQRRPGVEVSTGRADERRERDVETEDPDRRRIRCRPGQRRRQAHDRRAVGPGRRIADDDVALAGGARCLEQRVAADLAARADDLAAASRKRTTPPVEMTSMSSHLADPVGDGSRDGPLGERALVALGDARHRRWSRPPR